MLTIAGVLLFALSRAELVERFRSPIVTQADGMIKVYANCPEDMRREYQSPIARFAADTVRMLYRGGTEKPRKFAQPAIVIHIGDVRTNRCDVIASAVTNDARVLTRIYIPSPGFADLALLRGEIIKAFSRAVVGREIGEAEAVKMYRRSDPKLRVIDERRALDAWLDSAVGSDEEGFVLLRKIFEPGIASRRDVLTFASRLYLYPPQFDIKMLGRYDRLEFSALQKLAKDDLGVRMLAIAKANEMPVFGGGRGEKLKAAAESYRQFLLAFAAQELDGSEIDAMLAAAETSLNVAYEEARINEKQQNHN